MKKKDVLTLYLELEQMRFEKSFSFKYKWMKNWKRMKF